MTSRPHVKIGEWISVSGIAGLVIDVFPEYLTVGYYQNQTKAIKDEVVWDGVHWKFKSSGPDGSYLHGSEEAAVKRGPPRRT